ncbi:endoribonuclease L-PSP [Fusarium albosuccineum]|uniref:Endoribonuclease L-PSP n=1 Tax=Fusarium albosuccineum TaxID=1237068 RepID=A0A8H4KZD4_9HYPO|nr:endoribonuclease L-PSP [Fusarium albosuccineum]
MSYREPVFTTAACAPLPQFSQAIKYNGMVYCSGSIGIDPVTDELVSGTITDRARVALQNLKAVLEAAGSSLERVVKANIFLVDMKDFEAVNIAWDEFFPSDPKPCRTCVAVHQLPLDTDVEIEMTASCD